MGWRNEQCRKICRIIDNYLANRPTERDSLNVAVRKAFDALEQAETNCSEIPNNSDTIIRQQAIDALCKSECGWNNAECRHRDNTDFCVTCDNVREIKSLPSAQPDIIRCKDCEFWTKQEASIQGRCALHKMYPSGNWYCGTARRRGGAE